MIVDLPQKFDEYARGAIRSSALERELLLLCRETPASTWDVLAVLDQYYRRGKVSSERCRSLRQKIERQALGLERFEYLDSPESAAAAPEPAAESPAAEPPAAEPPALEPQAAAPIGFAPAGRDWPTTRSPVQVVQVRAARPAAVSGINWRQYFRISAAVAAVATILGIAPAPAERDGHTASSADGSAAGAPAAQAPIAVQMPSTSGEERGPALLSLSSDQYVVYPNQRSVEIAVERADERDGEASFLWWTQDSGAKANEDFVATGPRRAQFPQGSDSVRLRVPILANPQRRHIQMFYVVIGKPSPGAALGSVRRAAVFILP